MSPRLAVELTPTQLHAVLAAGWRDAPLRTVQVPWSPSEPETGVDALRSALGRVDAIALAVGLGLLHVKRLELPPAPHAERQRMLALESERFFAVGESCAVALAPGGTVAFAVEEVALERWRACFERWAPVVRIEASPVALAHAFGAEGRGEFLVGAGADEYGYVRIEGGVITAARRIPQAVGAPAGSELPMRAGVPGSHLAGWGALLAEDMSPEGTLATPALRSSFSARRWRRLFTAVLAAAAGFALALLSADRWRERTLRALQDDVAARRSMAAPGEVALAATARLDAELSRVAGSLATRRAALGELAAISSALPRDAVVLNAHVVGRDWQVDGTAASAAALVPGLDRDGRFENVRILAASSRFRDGARTRESFSIALRVRPGT